MPKMANLNMTVVDLSMKYVYGLVTLGFAMMTFRSVQVSIRHWKRGWSLLERPAEMEA
jgi:TRAP-type C4-dicarboxylate transport system permease small subunit